MQKDQRYLAINHMVSIATFFRLQGNVSPSGFDETLTIVHQAACVNTKLVKQEMNLPG